MYMAIVQSVQQLIVENTHALESVLTFRGQLKTVTPTNRPSETLPRCQLVRLPSLVPTGVLCSTGRHCIIVNSAMFAGILSLSTLQCLQKFYHRQICSVCRHVSSSTLQCLRALYHCQLCNVCRHVSSSTLQCLRALYHRQLCNVCRHCIIVNSTMFTGTVSSSTPQCLQPLYHRQLCNVCRHVSLPTL